MRICLIGNGRSIHVMRWVDYLMGRGHEVHVITDKPDPSSTAKVHKLWCPGSGLCYSVKGSQAKKIIEQIRPDIVHSHFVQGYGHFGAVSGFHPFIVTAWGSDVLVYPNKSKGARAQVERTFECADAVTCMAQNMFDTLRHEYSLGDKLKLVRWGIDTATFNRGYGEAASKLRTELGIPEGATVVLSPRGMLDIYGNHYLLEAVPDVLRKNRRVHFVFLRGAGKKSYENRIKRRARELGVADNMRFVEKMLKPAELAVYMNMSDISTSFVPFGQFGAVLLESMMCGCVQLASDIPVHREKMENMRNALLTDISDKKDIARQILFYVEHPETKDMFFESNRALIESTESWQKNAGATEKLYQRLIDRA